jgi:SAM-dependent methyltransferase
MKISYIGNYTQKHCTEVHIALTLEKLGHQVERLQENELQPGWVDKLEGTDLVLYTRTWGEFVTLEDLAKLKEKNITTASYHLDLYVGLSRKYLHGEHSIDEIFQTDPFWRTDYVFTPDGDPSSQEVFERNGVNHIYMKPGVFEGECVMAEPNPKHEVLFVGGGDRRDSPHKYGHPEWDYRNELIEWLYDTYGDRFTKFGHPEPTIRNDELNQLYADSKVVVGDSVCIGFNHTYYWSDRVYETIGRGGFMIHPYIKGLEEEFTDGETIVFYEFGNWNQLKEKIDYYLEHDEERERIRKAGHEFVKNNATYTQRLRRMLEIVTSGKFWKDAKEGKVYIDEGQPIRINLGAGSEPEEGWINCDWIAQPHIQKVFNLLEYPWPFDDNSADEMMARDVLEHMPMFTPDNKSNPIEFVRECWRILKPGGKLFMTMPHWQSHNLWIDPTHIRGYDEKSFDYFDPETDFGKWYGYYSLDRKFRVEAVRTPNDNVEFTLIKL